MENKLRKVKIKTWEEMEKEFGLTDDGNIKVFCIWIKEMEYLIPKDRIIEIDFKNVWNVSIGYDITKDMIAEYITENIETPSQREINKTLLNSLSHRTGHIHYIKWNITSNLSIRYFYNFTDKPEYNMKFTLKNHKERTLVELDEKTAKEMIENVCKDEHSLEIIGYEVKGKNKGYRKLIMKNGEVSEIYETYNDKLIKN